MGDHRASIKIQAVIHDKPYVADFWINYSPDDDGLDYRIKDFFCKMWNDSLLVYNDLIQDAQGREVEKKERQELERLASKYNYILHDD